jgi:ketosteroid isomerase-like protein
MRRWLYSVLRQSLRFGALAIVCFSPPSRATPDQDAEAADHAFTAAIAKPDPAAATALLDEEFTCTDAAGKTRTKAEILPALGSLAATNESEVQVLDKGQVVLIRGSHRLASTKTPARFVRIWVKRPQAWQLLIDQQTAMAEKLPERRSGFGSPSGGAPVSCENPCKTVPYEPETADQQEVVSMWQAVERTVLSNDVAAWIPNFTDDFLFVTPDGGTPLNKADRVAMIKELRRTNTTLIPAEVVSMKVWVFGDAAVMRSEHKPVRGNLLHVTRLFVKQSGHWKIAFGQQTVVE